MIYKDKNIINLDIPSIDIKSIQLIKKSLNSDIYSVIYKGKKCILKKYKSNDINRITRETNILKLLNKNNFSKVPKIYLSDKKNKFVIMNFINGVPPTFNESYIIQIADYINKMQSFIKTEEKINIPLAAESAFSINEHFEKTIQKLYVIKENIKIYKEANKIFNLIELEILPWINKYKLFLEKDNYAFNKKINHNQMILSQSDIGIHNSIIYKGQLFTFDYEYAGLDDPSKTFCDLFLHPSVLLDEYKMSSIFSKIKSFKIFNNSYNKSLKILPLYRYKWFAIIINSFLKNKLDNPKQAQNFLDKALDYLEKTYKPINSVINETNLKL